MMKLSRIITNRRIDAHHSNDLLYEWEDELQHYFGATLFYNHPWKNERYSKFIPFLLRILQTNEPAFTFEMCVYRHNGNNKRNIIPCILDFYLHKPWMAKCWHAFYWRNPAICVSSKEVYEYLTNELGLAKIHHLPQSLSDKYRITENTLFHKQYDVFIAARQDKVLLDFLQRYIELHPDTTFVRRIQREGRNVYINEQGECIRESDTREIYLELMRSSRICLYAAQGMADGRVTNGFHQVTPHFLEIIASGCHPIMRYPQNADTQWYDLKRFGPSLDTYGEFERAMDVARQTPVDMKMYSDYMNNHYTSVIAKQLQEILKNL